MIVDALNNWIEIKNLNQTTLPSVMKQHKIISARLLCHIFSKWMKALYRDFLFEVDLYVPMKIRAIACGPNLTLLTHENFSQSAVDRHAVSEWRNTEFNFVYNPVHNIDF